jgi:dihydroneopterin aldolase
MDRFDAIRHNGFSAVSAASAASDAAMQHAAFDPSARQASHAPMDIVYIEGFTGQTVIGIDHGELHAPQPVRMSLAIGVPAIRACTTDRIEDTINYAAVREALHGLLVSHGTQLLEALAEKVAQLLIADFGAHWVRVSLAKPAKFEDVESVGVLIERCRDETRAVYATCASLGEGLIPN